MWNQQTQNHTELKENLISNQSIVQLNKLEIQGETILEQIDCNLLELNKQNEDFQNETNIDLIQQQFIQIKSLIESIKQLHFDKQEHISTKVQILNSFIEQIKIRSHKLEMIQSNIIRKSVNNYDRGGMRVEGDPEQRMQMQYAMNNVYQDREQLDNKQQEINQIHKLLYTVKDLVNDAGNEIDKQGQMLLVINRNVEQTHEKVVNANKEINTANKYSGHSKKKTISMCILIVFIILIVTLIVVSSQ